MRAHELAKEFGYSNQEFLNIIIAIGVKAKSHLSGISDKDIEKIRKNINKKSTKRTKISIRSFGKNFGYSNEIELREFLELFKNINNLTNKTLEDITRRDEREKVEKYFKGNDIIEGKRKIKEVKVKRFKNIEDITVKIEDVNLLIGANNSGKSSLLQGMHFGITSMQTFRYVNDNIKLLSGTNVTYDEMLYKPIDNIKKLGHKRELGREEHGHDIKIAYLGNSGEKIELMVETGRARGNSINLKAKGSLEFFNYLSDIQNTFSYYVTGLSGILGSEEKRSNAIVKELAAKGASNSVFRNIIYLLSQKKDENGIKSEWEEFQKIINQIFEGYKIYVDYDEDNHKEIIVEVENNGIKIPIDSMGTSFLQIVQMISYILLYKPTLIIVDEPDAHLHPNKQRLIMDILLDIRKKYDMQIIVSTHSNHIINCIKDSSNVIYLEEGNAKPIENDVEKDVYSFLLNIGALEKRESIFENENNLIITEGKTDWKHIKRAFKNFDYDKSLFRFLEYENEIDMGDKSLLELCKNLSKIPREKKLVCIFDRDNKSILKEHENEIKAWGNNVYSIIIPSPSHRGTDELISIEHYYNDNELKIFDNNGRRMFLGYEFDSDLGIFEEDGSLICKEKNKCGQNSIKILDCNVYKIQDKSKNIALSKNEFANNILEGKENFDNHSYEEFQLILDRIHEILDME